MPFDSLPDDDALDPYSARVSRAFERVGPAVAHIAALDSERRPRGIGSGVVFTPDGYLLTNDHVIAGARQLSASLPDGRIIEGSLVGSDPAPDLAVLRLPANSLSHAAFPRSAGRLLRGGRARRSRLGIAAQAVPLDRRVARHLERTASTAVMTSDIAGPGPAERAGLAKGDVLLRFAGEGLRGVDDLHRLLTIERAETEVPIEILRAGRLLTRTITPEADS